MTMQAPKIIKGETISLRKLCLSDADNVYKHAKTKAVARWSTVPHPYPDGGAVKFIRSQQKQWREGTGFAYAIELNQGNSGLIGIVDLLNISKKHKCGVIGYWLAKRYWGRGIMTKATGMLIAMGFEHLKLERIYSHAFDENIGSQRVLEKCGMTHEGTMRKALTRFGRRHDLINYGLLRSEY